MTGGGSGGHFFPLIAVAREIKKTQAETEFIFIGPSTIGEEALAIEGIPHKKIMSGKFRRYGSVKNFVDIFKFPVGFFQSLWYLFSFMPNALLSKGGYGSVPVVLAAWIFRIPILTHESDSIPGLANKISAKLSKRIAISFKSTLKFFPEKKVALTGNPVRHEILTGSREEGLKMFNPSGQKPVILIWGGSQGAQALNDVVFAALPSLLTICNIIHQCGQTNLEPIKQMMANEMPDNYFLIPFLDENQERLAFAASDLIISRAGANSIAEIAALGKPSIIVPLPESARDHQRQNALEYSEYGASEIIEQTNLTPHLFVNRVGTLLQDKNLLKKMGDNAKAFYRVDANERIAKEILEIAKY